MRYAAVFQDTTGPAFKSWSSVTGAVLTQRISNQSALGFKLAKLCAYRVNGDTRFAAIFEQSPLAARYFYGLSEEQFHERHVESADMGFSLVSVSNYEAPDGMPRFAAVWHNLGDPRPNSTIELNLIAITKKGNYVTIKHANDYYHLRSGVTAPAINAAVSAGDPLGVGGSSGNSSAPHLHLGVLDQAGNAICPMTRGLFTDPPPRSRGPGPFA